MILDADLTVAPEDLPRFLDALQSGKGEFINGVRLVYPMEKQAMRFFNLIGNKLFSLAFSWLLGQSIKDTLCGTKVLREESRRSVPTSATSTHLATSTCSSGQPNSTSRLSTCRFGIENAPMAPRTFSAGDTAGYYCRWCCSPLGGSSSSNELKL
jgi:hypothetical protein